MKVAITLSPGFPWLSREHRRRQPRRARFWRRTGLGEGHPMQPPLAVHFFQATTNSTTAVPLLR